MKKAAHDRIIFIMEIPHTEKTSLYWDWPWIMREDLMITSENIDIGNILT